MEDVLSILKRKKEELKVKGISVLIEENPLTVVVITPIMRRSHAQKFAGENVFVDSTGCCDQVIF